MERHAETERSDWQESVERVGLTYHTRPDGMKYWNEEVFYVLTEHEIQVLAETSIKLNSMLFSTGKKILSSEKLFRKYLSVEKLPPVASYALVDSWKPENTGMCARVTLAWDPRSGEPPKLVNYSGEMHYGMVEQSAQVDWVGSKFPDNKQFSSLDIALAEEFVKQSNRFSTLHIAYPTHDATSETVQNVSWFAGRATESGLNVVPSLWEAFAVDGEQQQWLDHQGSPIEACYHPFSFSSLLQSPSVEVVAASYDWMTWVEPAWRSVLSSNFMLPALYLAFPDSEYVVKSSIGKPLPAGETETISFPASHGEDSMIIHQEVPDSLVIDEAKAFFDVWLVAGEPVALGVMEKSPDSPFQFVPHIVE